MTDGRPAWDFRGTRDRGEDGLRSLEPPESLLVLAVDLDFVAYSADCRLRGRIALDTERLSDLLNGSGSYLLRDIEAESLEDGHVARLPELEVAADDLCVVEGIGPRGNPGRRIRTRTHRMQLQVGPYLIAGSLHAIPGADPLAGITRRGPFVALTDATLTYRRAGESVLDDVDIVLVNRELVEWIRPVGDEAVAFPNVPVKLDPHAKDLTWEVQG